MKNPLLIFPHQLFAAHPGLDQGIDGVILTEDPLFFGDDAYPCNFHCQKLILHRASMKQYEEFLKDKKFPVEYRDYAGGVSTLDTLFADLQAKGVETLHCAEVVDFTLEKRITSFSKQYDIEIIWHQTPLYINTNKDNQNYRATKKRWFMADFYQWQRKRLNILIDENAKPVGGKWSFDEDNRKRLPKRMIDQIPQLDIPDESEYVQEARSYVAEHFPRALGNAATFYYPISHEAAQQWLESFLHQRLRDFGPYEDAIVADQNWLYHSILTPMLNIGLLTPQQVVMATLEYSDKNDVPLNSLEGFIRQIIGWREFMRATYDDLGVQMRTTNHWQHHRKIPASFYDGTTGIVPIDNAIKRILKTGYCHHIERLMVLGGFMFLCEFDPNEIYRWFMEMFIDSYDWVMVPNVYAMSQHADGGLITTKPYFSGSNYVAKMSHYNRKEAWAESWDGLYWRWILKHANSLRKNPRWAMMVRMAEKMDQAKKDAHIKAADEFLQTL